MQLTRKIVLPLPYLFFFLFSFPIPYLSYAGDIAGNIKRVEEKLSEIERKMVTREEFKLFVEMVNKRFEDMQRYMDKRFEDINRRFEDMNRRFEDMNRRFEDMFSFMMLGFGILGTLLGAVLGILGFFGARILKRLEEIQKRLERMEVERVKEMFSVELRRLKVEIREEIMSELKDEIERIKKKVGLVG